MLFSHGVAFGVLRKLRRLRIRRGSATQCERLVLEIATYASYGAYARPLRSQRSNDETQIRTPVASVAAASLRNFSE
jgi:hypothetical protein